MRSVIPVFSLNTGTSGFKPLLMLAMVFALGELKTCVPFVPIINNQLHAASPSKTNPALMQLKKIGAYAAPLSAGHKEVRVDFSIGAQSATDSEMQKLTELSGLVELNLGNTQITDKSLEIISKITSLKKLNLNNTKITDSGIKSLAKLSKLEYLNLYGCQKVTDASVATLSSMKSLKRVYLWKSGISANAGKKLATSLADAQINTGVDFEKFKKIKADIQKREAEAKAKAEAEKKKAAAAKSKKEKPAAKPLAAKADSKLKSIEAIMKEAHKSGLSKKVITGKGSDADKKKLVAYYKMLIQHKAPQGSQDEWKKRTKALLDAAEKVVKGEKNSQLLLSKVINCKSCHKVHKP